MGSINILHLSPPRMADAESGFCMAKVMSMAEKRQSERFSFSLDRKELLLWKI
jgi:hypothetical protein